MQFIIQCSHNYCKIIKYCMHILMYVKDLLTHYTMKQV